MQLDRRFLTVVSVSLAWSAIVTWWFYRAVAGGPPRVRAESQKQIVVAARALPVGSTISADAVKVRAVPESFAPAGSYQRIEEVLDRPVINQIQPDEPVVDARLAPKGSGVGLAPMIPRGMRAIAVRVNDVVGVAGFVLPGMRVDVLVTGRPPNQADTITRTVLQNIAVLSAGQTTQTDGKSQSINAPVVTLLVNPSDAEALTLANNEGHIQLVLRNSVDGQASQTTGRRMREIFGMPAPPPERIPDSSTSARSAPAAARRSTRETVAPPPVAFGPPGSQMILMHGKDQKVVAFEPGGTQ